MKILILFSKYTEGEEGKKKKSTINITVRTSLNSLWPSAECTNSSQSFYYSKVVKKVVVWLTFYFWDQGKRVWKGLKKFRSITENNSITEQLDLWVTSCTGCEEDKSKQLKLDLMNKGESRKGKEMSDMVKAKRQEISAQHPGELKALCPHTRRVTKGAQWRRQNGSYQCSKTYYWLKYTWMPKGDCKNLLGAVSLSSTDSLALLQAEVLELIFYALHYERRYVFIQRMYKEGGEEKILQQHKTK